MKETNLKGKEFRSIQQEAIPRDAPQWPVGQALPEAVIGSAILRIACRIDSGQVTELQSMKLPDNRRCPEAGIGHA